jgi:hypothetical protein
MFSPHLLRNYAYDSGDGERVALKHVTLSPRLSEVLSDEANNFDNNQVRIGFVLDSCSTTSFKPLLTFVAAVKFKSLPPFNMSYANISTQRISSIKNEKPETTPGSLADRSFLTHLLRQDEASNPISNEYHYFLLPTISSYPANPAAWPYTWDKCDIHTEGGHRKIHRFVLQSTQELVSNTFSVLTSDQQSRRNALLRRFKDREGNKNAQWSLQHIGLTSTRHASASQEQEQYVILKRSDRRCDDTHRLDEGLSHRRHVRSRREHAPERSRQSEVRSPNHPSSTHSHHSDISASN